MSVTILAFVILGLIILTVELYDKWKENRKARYLDDNIEKSLLMFHKRTEVALSNLNNVVYKMRNAEKMITLLSLSVFINFLCIKRIKDKLNILEFRKLKFSHDVFIKNCLKEIAKTNGSYSEIEYESMYESYVNQDDDDIEILLGASRNEVICTKVITMLMGQLGRMNLMVDIEFKDSLIKWYTNDVIPVMNFYDENIINKILKNK